MALPKIQFKILFNSKYYSIKKNSTDLIQKTIQFNSQGLIDTGQKGKVPKNYSFNIRFNIAFPKIQFKILFNSKKSADSIQKITQVNSQRIIDTSQIGIVPKYCPKSVQNRQKGGLFIKNGKSRFKI